LLTAVVGALLILAGFRATVVAVAVAVAVAVVEAQTVRGGSGGSDLVGSPPILGRGE
jgi:hypothetical protein